MSEPRYGIWAPVGGNFGPLNSPDEPIDASYERTRSLLARFPKVACGASQHKIYISGADCNSDLIAYLLFWVLDMAQKPKFAIVHMYDA
ncbi:MAG: hypothetical protein V7L29_08650 [Nostoc sp.]|uniref:hypothetical protein n=1 Tax=Nostoc sp. TaxID=1180 RepID=UPI002FF5E549